MLQGLIERFRPVENDLYDIKEMLPIFEPYVKRLEVNELLPHVVMVVSVSNN